MLMNSEITIWFVGGFVASVSAIALLVLSLIVFVIRSDEGEHDGLKKALHCVAFLFALSGTVVVLAYTMEFYTSWFSDSAYERHQFRYRLSGPHGWVFWMMLICHCIPPLLVYVPAIRRNAPALFVCALLFNVGMGFERWNISLLYKERTFSNQTGLTAEVDAIALNGHADARTTL